LEVRRVVFGWQEAGGRRGIGGRRQEAGGRRQEGNKRQEAGGRRGIGGRRRVFLT
ncbi:MAG: hypothetical protein F6K41_28285, partial [Symploca sp. SIO3E6]|nr:hypothetical protein [Caldora sp. SIO3E6]